MVQCSPTKRTTVALACSLLFGISLAAWADTVAACFTPFRGQKTMGGTCVWNGAPNVTRWECTPDICTNGGCGLPKTDSLQCRVAWSICTINNYDPIPCYDPFNSKVCAPTTTVVVQRQYGFHSQQVPCTGQ
jgi:hypothetical protein